MPTHTRLHEQVVLVHVGVLKFQVRSKKFAAMIKLKILKACVYVYEKNV